ncbi:hypothetical protein GQX74_001470 [Glossina fuscipes]|nr:hypothetical protein GQX74_001470 [Glossina fuscipes]
MNIRGDYYRDTTSGNPIEEMYFSQPRLLALYKKENGNFSLSANLEHFRLPSANSYPIKLTGDHSFSQELRSVLNWRMTAGRNNFISPLKNKTRVYTTENTLNYLLSFPLLPQISDVCFLSIVRFNNDLYIGDIKPCKSNFAATDRRLENILCTDIFPSESDTRKPTGRKIRYEAIYHSTLHSYDIIYSGTTPATIPYQDDDVLPGRKFVISNVEPSNLNEMCKLRMFLSLWYTAHLQNVKQIYAAKKSDDLVHGPIQCINVNDIPDIYLQRSMSQISQANVLHTALHYISRRLRRHQKEQHYQKAK